MVTSVASAGGSVSPSSPPSSSPPTLSPAALTGVGAPASKSVEFSPVAAMREIEVVLEVPGAGASPENVVALPPQPTRSTTVGSSEQATPPHSRASSVSVKAMVPAEPPSARSPVRSGVGKAVLPPLPWASWTRKVPPAGTVPVRGIELLPKLPVAEA